MVFRSLKSTLYGLLALVALPGIATICYQLYFERLAAVEKGKDQAVYVSERIRFSQEKIIDETHSYLMKLVLAGPVQRPESVECNAFLGMHLGFDQRFVNLGVPNVKGDLLCNALPLIRDINVFDRAYFQESVTKQAFSISDFQFDRAAQQHSVNFSYPVIAPTTGNIVGVAVAVISLDWLKVQLSEFELPLQSMAYISDGKQIIVSYPENLAEEIVVYPTSSYGAFSKSDVFTEVVKDHNGIVRAFTHTKLYETASNREIVFSVGIPFDDAIAGANSNFIRSLQWGQTVP